MPSPHQRYREECTIPSRATYRCNLGRSHRLRLVERTRNMDVSSTEQLRYAALSYCWGPSEDAQLQSKTTKETHVRHLESLDFESLSPVLKDAVKVTRNLSIPYLWVDSLCILQDDISDWERQCRQMNDIYGKACITLIAASSSTCQEGFLQTTRPALRKVSLPVGAPTANQWLFLDVSRVCE